MAETLKVGDIGERDVALDLVALIDRADTDELDGLTYEVEGVTGAGGGALVVVVRDTDADERTFELRVREVY